MGFNKFANALLENPLKNPRNTHVVEGFIKEEEDLIVDVFGQSFKTKDAIRSEFHAPQKQGVYDTGYRARHPQQIESNHKRFAWLNTLGANAHNGKEGFVNDNFRKSLNQELATIGDLLNGYNQEGFLTDKTGRRITDMHLEIQGVGKSSLSRGIKHDIQALEIPKDGLVHIDSKGVRVQEAPQNDKNDELPTLIVPLYMPKRKEEQALDIHPSTVIKGLDELMVQMGQKL